MTRLTFFSLPPEIRNEIYNLVWTPLEPHKSSLIEALLLEVPAAAPPPCPLTYLNVCRQVRQEAQYLAISRHDFHLNGKLVLPEDFLPRISVLSISQISSIRHITITARISHLRAMNETWNGLPFGSKHLQLDKLTIIPQKPDATGCYAEVAEHSQCTAFSYVLGETLKSIRNVRTFEIQNHSCFKDFIWRLMYRCLVYRMWKWGGLECGHRFACSDSKLEGSGNEWFKVFIGDSQEGLEVGEEVCRMMGHYGVNPEAPGPLIELA